MRNENLLKFQAKQICNYPQQPLDKIVYDFKKSVEKSVNGCNAGLWAVEKCRELSSIK